MKIEIFEMRVVVGMGNLDTGNPFFKKATRQQAMSPEIVRTIAFLVFFRNTFEFEDVLLPH